MNEQPPVILVSPDMRPSIMGVARSLAEAGLLQRFVTTVAVGNGSEPRFLHHLPDQIGSRLRSKFKSREVPGYLNVPVETYPARELMNLAGRRAGLGDIASHYLWEWAETSFDHKVAVDWAGRAPVIYGCEHASVETFKMQKAAGGANILWQVIAHHESVFSLLREEYQRFPDAMTSYVQRMFQDADRINKRKDEQFASSDLIVTNSEFSRQTFIAAGFSEKQVQAIPTGCPPVVRRSLRKHRGSQEKMIFLCAGTQSVRKGIPYLLEAWKQLPATVPAELWLVGKMELPDRLLVTLPASVAIKPSVSRSELQQIFDQADVLVLPTLCEGLAHIVLEAMASGLAVITTENSGCGDLVENEVNGWKVPIRDADALAQKISWSVEEAAAVEQMGVESQAKASAWQEEDFSITHANMIRQFLLETTQAMVPSSNRPSEPAVAR